MKNLKIFDVRAHKAESAFLIDDGTTSILYDSGFAFTAEKVAQNIKEVLGSRNLDYIFLTHSHYDHVLGSAYLLKHWPDAKVVAGEYAAKIFAKDSAKNVMRDLDSKFAKACGAGEYEDLTDNLRVDVSVSDGDIITAGNLKFSVINLPGHTRCSVGFYCADLKLLLACETLGVLNGENDVFPLYLVGYKMVIESFEKIEKLDIEAVLAPHYGLITGDVARNYLKLGKESSISVANEIVEKLKNGVAKEKILEDYRKQIYHGYAKEIYPIDAMNLNTRIMIDLLEKEFII